MKLFSFLLITLAVIGTASADTFIVCTHEGQQNQVVNVYNNDPNCDVHDTVKIGTYEAIIVDAPSADILDVNGVATIDEDGEIHASVRPEAWGIDRINQHNLPIDNDATYAFPAQGSGATVYIVDSGVDIGLAEFGGRASNGADFVDGTFALCHSHGTHCAGTAATTDYGVAEQASIVNVRVLGCGGSGSWAGFISALGWVNGHCAGRCVVSMSLGGGANGAADGAVNAIAAAGLLPICAAGNNNAPTCNHSPARAAGCVSIGASDSSDNRASFSNYGACTNFYAPGKGIKSLLIGGGTASWDGTSMAAPHAAGAAALHWAENPGWSKNQVINQMNSDLTLNKIGNTPAGINNNLLYLTPPRQFDDDDGSGYDDDDDHYYDDDEPQEPEDCCRMLFHCTGCGGNALVEMQNSIDILNNGGLPVCWDRANDFTTSSAAMLAKLATGDYRVLTAMNHDNGSPVWNDATETAIRGFVSAGLHMSVWDRYANNNVNVPDLDGFVLRDFSENPDWLVPVTPGIPTDTGIRGTVGRWEGSWSNHGIAPRCIAGTFDALHPEATRHFRRLLSGESVMVEYEIGDGCIVYTTCPADYYYSCPGCHQNPDWSAETWVTNTIEMLVRKCHDGHNPWCVLWYKRLFVNEAPAQSFSHQGQCIGMTNGEGDYAPNRPRRANRVTIHENDDCTGNNLQLDECDWHDYHDMITNPENFGTCECDGNTAHWTGFPEDATHIQCDSDWAIVPIVDGGATTTKPVWECYVCSGNTCDWNNEIMYQVTCDEP
jgi:hypothetical protein